MPDNRRQVRIGVIVTAIVVVALLVLALVPDPLHRQRVLTVGLDQVEGINPGAPVFFRGAQIGTVRDVALIPATRTFDVRVGVRRDWQASQCSFMTVAAANPLTQPHLELVALETTAPACPVARAAKACDPIVPFHRDTDWLPGCKRAPDLIALATTAITQAANVARTAGALAAQLQGAVTGGGGKGLAAGLGGTMQASAQNLAAILADLNRAMKPGSGDIALTLSNVRRATGQASQFDIKTVNGTLGAAQGVLTDNRRAIGQIVANGAAISDQTNALLQTSSRSLAETSANLARVSASMDALAERLTADPTYVVRGQKYSDPPPVHSKP